jgi:hypothetical protein
VQRVRGAGAGDLCQETAFIVQLASKGEGRWQGEGRASGHRVPVAFVCAHFACCERVLNAHLARRVEWKESSESYHPARRDGKGAVDAILCTSMPEALSITHTEDVSH